MLFKRPRRVIIDTDPGVDDALAILLALRSPELHVVAITTVCGNVPVEQATSNLFRILPLVTPPADLLIGQGAARPLRRPLETATHIHGADGLGELDSFRNPNSSLRYPSIDAPPSLPTAQDVWQECVRRYPDDLTLITLGPLTNLASALETDPETIRKIRTAIIMGGAIHVPGNVTPAAEFNMFVDPDAAQRVFQSGLSLTLVPLDVTTKVALSRQDIRTMADPSADPVCRFISDATGKALDYSEQIEGSPVFQLHDPLAVGVAVDPRLIRTAPLHVEVETDGHVTRGMTVADRRTLRNSFKTTPNLHVALDVDVARTLKLFQDRLCRK